MSGLLESLKAALRVNGAAPPHAPDGHDLQPPEIALQPIPGLPPVPEPAPMAMHANGTGARRFSPASVADLELELLLEALFQCHGYDYRGYDRGIVMGKVRALCEQLELATISALQARVLHDSASYNALLRALYVEDARMFDNAQEISMLRLSLGICLPGAALPRVWIADCAGAHQAWTLAILLEQEQLLQRTEIYATVASDIMLAEVQQASLPMTRLSEMQGNYLRSGGVGKLIDYFDINEDGIHAVLKPRLRERITWAQYNLVTDASFNEFQMILAQRALPDFGAPLRRRVLQLFSDSLAPFGMLALDRPFDEHDPLARHYKAILAHQSWYKRIS